MNDDMNHTQARRWEAVQKMEKRLERLRADKYNAAIRHAEWERRVKYARDAYREDYGE